MVKSFRKDYDEECNNIIIFLIYIDTKDNLIYNEIVKWRSMAIAAPLNHNISGGKVPRGTAFVFWKLFGNIYQDT